MKSLGVVRIIAILLILFGSCQENTDNTIIESVILNDDTSTFVADGGGTWTIDNEDVTYDSTIHHNVWIESDGVGSTVHPLKTDSILYRWTEAQEPTKPTKGDYSGFFNPKKTGGTRYLGPKDGKWAESGIAKGEKWNKIVGTTYWQCCPSNVESFLINDSTVWMDDKIYRGDGEILSPHVPRGVVDTIYARMMYNIYTMGAISGQRNDTTKVLEAIRNLYKYIDSTKVNRIMTETPYNGN